MKRDLILDFHNENLTRLHKVTKELVDIMADYSYNDINNNLLLDEIKDLREYIVKRKEEDYKALTNKYLNAKAELSSIAAKIEDKQMLLFKTKNDDEEELKDKLEHFKKRTELYEKELSMYDNNNFTKNLEE